MDARQKGGASQDIGVFVAQLVAPVKDRLWHRALGTLVRFRAWLLGGVYTAGALALVVRDDGSFLFVKPWYREGWGLPGGFMKHGEQSADALRRELLEETGLVIDPDRAHEVYVQRRRRHIDHLFVVRVSSDQIAVVPSRCEITGLSWHPPDDLPPLQREAHEALQRFAG